MKRPVPGWLPPVIFLLLVLISKSVLPPHLSSDSYTYLEGMTVLQGMPPSDTFLPSIFLTTIGGLTLVTKIASFTGGTLTAAWYFINAWFYVFGLWAFWLFLRKFLRDSEGWVSLLGAVLLGLNYCLVSFGLNYLTDMGGYFFYLVGVYCAYRFLEEGESSHLYWGAALIGFGGLFKEYALCASIPLVSVLVYRDHKTPKILFRRLLITALLGAGPVVISSILQYYSLHFTYANWFAHNQKQYGLSYASRTWEYVKVLGSLFTFLWFLILPSLYFAFRSRTRLLDSRRTFFLFTLLLSALPAFIWPAITQRIFFVTVVAGVVLVSVLFKEKSSYWRWYVLPVLLYVFSGYTMDPLILPLVDVDAFIQFLK